MPHFEETISGGGVLASGTSGNLSGGTTADMTQSMTSTYTGSTLFDSTYTSSSVGNGTGVATFSGTFQATIDGNGSQNVSIIRSSNSGNGNAVSINESAHQTNQIHGTINSSISGQETIVTVGGQVTSDNESVTVTQTGTLTLTIDDTSHMNDVTTSVDPVTNLATTTTNQDNGSTNHAVTTLVPTFTAVHTETLGGTPTDAVSGGANATTQSTYQGHLQETVAWVGTDAQGVTHNNQQTIGISVTTTGTTTEQDTFAADGSSTSTATTQQSSQGTQTTTNSGTISSVDATTGLLNTTLLNEVFTISGTTTATIGTIQSTDASNTTTHSSTKTDGGTLAQGWQIHDSTTQTDSSGHTVGTQATNETNQNTLTLENGSLTSQGAPTPSPPGNQNSPAPGAGTSGGGSSSGGGWSDWYPWNWNRQDAEAIGTALATNPIQNYQTNSRLDELAHKRNMDNIMDMVNGGNNNVDLAKARLTHFAPPARALNGAAEDAKTFVDAVGGAANIADRTVSTVFVVKGAASGLGRAGARYFLPRDTGGLKAGWSYASNTGVKIASGMGGEILAAEKVRTIAKGEKVADLIQELAESTYKSGGVEHAIVSLKDGSRIIVKGGPGGIQFGDDVNRIILHTHPIPTGPSPQDYQMLELLGQTSSYIYELFGGGLTRFTKK